MASYKLLTMMYTKHLHCEEVQILFQKFHYANKREASSRDSGTFTHGFNQHTSDLFLLFWINTDILKLCCQFKHVPRHLWCHLNTQMTLEQPLEDSQQLSLSHLMLCFNTDCLIDVISVI